MVVLSQAESQACEARAGCTAGTPAALAGLLLEAPQAVPFPDRVALMRALIAADKARSALQAALCQVLVTVPHHILWAWAWGFSDLAQWQGV